MMHDGADTINADPGICGLAVPKPRTQALDLLDDHRFRSGALRTMRRQAAGDLRQMVQPHGNVKPIQNRRLGDTSVEEDAPQPGTAVGEGCQHRRVGASDSIEAAADQCGEIRVEKKKVDLRGLKAPPGEDASVEANSRKLAEDWGAVTTVTPNKGPLASLRLEIPASR